jgi:Domain of unknown function (DUF4112)
MGDGSRPTVTGELITDPARTARLDAAERRIAMMTRIFDNAVEVPGTGRRFGLDPIIGLIPVVGDLAGAIASFWIIGEAAKFKLPTIVLARMVVYASLDMLLGAIPLIGNVLDFFSKANDRNLELFRRHASDPDASTADTRLFFIGLGVLFIGLAWLTLELFRWLLSLLISALGL